MNHRATRNRILKLAIFVGLAFFFVACHNARQVPGTAPVYYSDERSVSLLPTASMTEKLDMPQHIVGEFHKPDGSTDSFEADSWVRANDSVLFRDSVKVESSLMNVEKMKAEYLLADFQICFYPFGPLQKNFEQAGFEFSETRSGAGNADFVRTLSENGKTILTAKKTGAEIRLVNDLRGYSYHITLGEEN